MDTVTRKPYSTDLTDEQWAILEPLIPSLASKLNRNEVENWYR